MQTNKSKIMAVTREQIREARKAGYRKKKPKKPTGKQKTMNSMDEWLSKVDDWEKDIKKAAALQKKIDKK